MIFGRMVIATLGGKFQGILRAALGIQIVILRMIDCHILLSELRSLGTTPTSGKTALGVKRPFSELSASFGQVSA